ncbi:MAG: flavodoxin domain-containing protein [Candidatus Thorarchaeota archaeon]
MRRDHLKKAQDIKTLIILYDSVYGNTKKVAMSLNRGLEAGGLHVDTISIQDFNISDLSDYDVIGIGGPTHMRGVSKQMKLFLSNLKHIRLINKIGFVFETKASIPLSGSAARKILRYLKMMKIEVLYPTITAIVVGREGPLEENTLTKMEEIGLDIAEKLSKPV